MKLTSHLRSAGPGIALGGVAALAIISILGIAGMVMSVQCTDGCGTMSEAPAPALAAIEPKPEPERLPPVSPLPEAPTLTVAERRDALLDATFEMLVSEITTTLVEAVPPAAAPEPSPVLPMAEGEAVRLAETAADPVDAEERPGSAREATSLVAIRPEPPVDAIAYAPAVASALSTAPDGVSVGASPVNVRAGPSSSQTRLFVLAAGDEVVPSARDKGWVKIAASDGREGWVDASYLDNLQLAALPQETQQTAANPEPTASVEPAPAATAQRTVGGKGVTVRSGPSNGSSRLFALTSGTKVSVTGNDKGWLKVTDPDGRTGWAYSGLFAAAP